MARLTRTIRLWPVLLLAALECAVAAEDRIVRVTTTDCEFLVRHRPAPDIAYQPGVDVRNRPVVPADLEAPRLRLPDTIEIPITVDLQKRFGIPSDSALFEAEAEIGRIAVEGDRITFNGRPLRDSELVALAEACRRRATGQP